MVAGLRGRVEEIEKRADKGLILIPVEEKILNIILKFDFIK